MGVTISLGRGWRVVVDQIWRKLNISDRAVI